MFYYLQLDEILCSLVEKYKVHCIYKYCIFVNNYVLNTINDYFLGL